MDTYTQEAYHSKVEVLRPDVQQGARRIVEEPLHLLLRQTDGNPTSWLAKRELFLKHGGCADHIFIQDYILELGLAAEGAMCVSPVPLFIAPESDAARVSANEEQTSHDLNMALAEFFRREPDCLSTYGKVALKRAYSRAWRFLKKKKVCMFEKCRYFTLYLMSKMGLLKPSVATIEAAAYPFRDYAKVRSQ